LSPLKEGRFNMAREGGVELDDDANLGRPENWKKHVQDQMRKLGSWSGTVRDYSGVQRGEPLAGTLGEPQPVGESMEDQIARIDNLLQEKDPNYDLRIYRIRIDCSVAKNLGGEIAETQTEIRGIEGITTVRTVGETSDMGNAHMATYEIKFEMTGQMSRVKYRDLVLIPGLMKIKGLKIRHVTPIHRTNIRGTIRTVRENKQILKEYGGFGSIGGFGGAAGALSSVRPQGRPMPTPRKLLASIAADWRDGGVMAYDAPMDTTDMRYHVMMPVSELLPYCGREFRAPKDAFDGMYQSFIKDGANGPVYVAVGKNGRVKVTGNEDLVWFAKKSGLQELAVFLSYQRQV